MRPGPEPICPPKPTLRESAQITPSVHTNNARTEFERNRPLPLSHP
jgi:hypothetical protein